MWCYLPAIEVQDVQIHLTFSLSSLCLASKESSSGVQLILTKDGSHTLYSPLFGAHYHSTHGALQESQHVFIQEGLDHYIGIYPEIKEVSILETGMGTGLNVWLTALHQFSAIKLHTIEAYPVDFEVVKKLNYAQDPIDKTIFENIHSCEWGIWQNLRQGFELKKEESLIEDFVSDDFYDIIYYDAFAPSAQGHLWQESTLSRIVQCMNTGGILVTFCAQGAFKRTLKALGMSIERVPGPPGKREMTRATKL